MRARLGFGYGPPKQFRNSESVGSLYINWLRPFTQIIVEQENNKRTYPSGVLLISVSHQNLQCSNVLDILPWIIKVDLEGEHGATRYHHRAMLHSDAHLDPNGCGRVWLLPWYLRYRVIMQRKKKVYMRRITRHPLMRDAAPLPLNDRVGGRQHR